MDFVVGQKVCEESHNGQPIRMLTVSKVGKRKMTLSNGSEWKIDGNQPWGMDDRYYTGSSIREARAGDEMCIRTRLAVSWATRARWGVVPLAVLEQVHALVKPHIDAWERGHIGTGEVK